MPDLPRVSRRAALTGAAVLAAGAAGLGGLAASTRPPRRAAGPASSLPDIQFDTAAYNAPEQDSVTGGPVVIPPVHTFYLTARLLRSPTVDDQQELARALDTMEAHYPFGAAGLITFVAYGVPYFARLPGGVDGDLVRTHVPRLRDAPHRLVLEEAQAGPTDVHPDNMDVFKLRYHLPVRIESNDLLITLRSDQITVLQDVMAWLDGSDTLTGEQVDSPAFDGLLEFTSSRHQFAQPGLPRAVAERNNLPFAPYLNPDSPMWMGFADQQVNAFGPPPICTFAGSESARLTTAAPGDYFDNGAIQHLSHVILDLLQWFDMVNDVAEPGENGVYTERLQYMFHSPASHSGYRDQLTDGGGPAFLPADDHGPDYAEQTAQGIGVAGGERRLGHLSTLQRVSRAPDGTPLHIRIDGPGFDAMDAPGGVPVPKLHFSMFVATADLFARMRHRQASPDLVARYGVAERDNGLERFTTCTRRQNFLIPPRRHRAFPLIEMAS